MTTFATAAALAFGCTHGAAASPSKYLLLDDRNVIDTTASFVLGKVSKHAAGAMIREEREYEMRFDNMQPNVWYDPVLAKWRAWYSAFTSCSLSKTSVPYCNNASMTCGTPTTSVRATRGTGLLYAESTDGITWYKPSLGMTEYKGSTDNNLIELDGMTTGIYLDESTTDPSQRYKVQTGSNSKGFITVSADGLSWNATKDLDPETFGRWDTPKNVIFDEVSRQWIMYMRSTPTPQGLRVQSYTHSLTDDYMGAWAPAVPTGLNTTGDWQPDGLVVWPYEGLYLGIGNVFNPTQAPAKMGAAIGQVNAVLGWSADGRRWKWLQPSQSLIPLGESGDFDSCGVFGAKQDPMRTSGDNDTLRLYYTGCNGPFFGSRGCALGMATIQRDGFAGYTGGSLSTSQVRVASTTLRVSVDGGSSSGIRVGILGSDDLSIENCEPLKGAQTDATVTWKGHGSDLSHYANGAISLEFDIPVGAVAFAFAV